jgi:hypothetical protein
MYITEKIFGKLTYAVFRFNYGAAVCKEENEEGRVFIQIKIETFASNINLVCYTIAEMSMS